VAAFALGGALLALPSAGAWAFEFDQNESFSKQLPVESQRLEQGSAQGEERPQSFAMVLQSRDGGQDGARRPPPGGASPSQDVNIGSPDFHVRRDGWTYSNWAPGQGRVSCYAGCGVGTPAAVPEPGTIGLMLVGVMAVLFAVGRRRRRLGLS
jgi:hypothetical protein